MAEKVLERNNTTMVPIPKSVAKDVGLHPGNYVEVTDDGYRIIITPKIDRKEEYTEEELTKLAKLAKTQKKGRAFKSQQLLEHLERLSKK